VEHKELLRVLALFRCMAVTPLVLQIVEERVNQ
jgi:hypothetical protein